jgi:hypothetical protein
MHKLLLMAAAFGLSAPATAQTTPQQASSNEANAAPAPQPKTVKKQVCEKVDVERSTGSRLSSTTRVCKMVEVPVTANDAQPSPTTGSNGRY